MLNSSPSEPSASIGGGGLGEAPNANLGGSCRKPNIPSQRSRAQRDGGGSEVAGETWSPVRHFARDVYPAPQHPPSPAQRAGTPPNTRFAREGENAQLLPQRAPQHWLRSPGEETH